MPRRPREWKSGQPSLADVATRAGVSAQTVSRVVNNSGRVVPETRARVELAISELGYRAHTAARALATNAFRSVGIVCFDLTKFGNLHVVDGAIHAARANDYGVYLGSVPDATQAELQAAIRGLADQAVDGLLIVEARILDRPEIQLPRGVPVIVAEGGGDLSHATVGVDHSEGTRLAVEHLLGLGHRTVHHISGLSSSHPALTRQAAWVATLEAAGAPVPPVAVGDWTAASGYRAAHDLLSHDAGDVSAIFAANDEMAAGALRAAAELGRAVPERLSVVGYDDAGFGAFLTPPLTTVHQDLAAVGRRCMERLMPAMREREELAPEAEWITPELVIRQSTAPPPVSNRS